MSNESLSFTGNLTITVLDQNGNTKEQFNYKNLVVDAGKDWIAECIRTTPGPDRISHMGIGTDTTAAVAGDTALGAEEARIEAATSGADKVITFDSTFPAGVGTGALAEAGLFNADSAGTMVCRTTFPVVNKGATDSIAINWNLTVN